MSKESYLKKVVLRESAETDMLKNDVLYIGAVVFDMLTAIYCNLGNFGSGFLGRTTAKKYVFLFLGRYFYFQYRSSPLLISRKVEITADNTV